MSNCHEPRSGAREYIPDVTKAFKCEHTLSALEAYISLRRSLTIPDDDNMSEGAMIALRYRTLEAYRKLSDECEGKTNAAMCAVLLAYANYLAQVMWERAHV